MIRFGIFQVTKPVIGAAGIVYEAQVGVFIGITVCLQFSLTGCSGLVTERDRAGSAESGSVL